MARLFPFAVAFLAILAAPLNAQGFFFATGDSSLDVSLNSINVQAEGDSGAYVSELSVSFGVPQPQIRTWMTVERLQPAEVYLVLELGRIAARPPATVIEMHRKYRGKGWGAVARALGIRPGSPEFRALKTSADERDRKLKMRKRR